MLILADELRAGTEAMLSELRAMGIERIVLATGDRHEVASFVATGLSLDLVRSELTPDQKILVVLAERKNGPVMMIGDGVNDAPALAAADVGVAMGAKGAAASAEAADVVLLVDQLDRILPAIRDRAAFTPDRLAKRDRRYRPVGPGDGGRIVRASGAGRRSCDSGGDRRGGHLQRAQGIAWLMCLTTVVAVRLLCHRFVSWTEY